MSSLFNNIITPTSMVVGSNLHLFKKGIRPMWEDKSNEKGGKWLLNSSSKRRNRIDENWLHTVCIVFTDASHSSFLLNTKQY